MSVVYLSLATAVRRKELHKKSNEPSLLRAPKWLEVMEKAEGDTAHPRDPEADFQACKVFILNYLRERELLCSNVFFWFKAFRNQWKSLSSVSAGSGS